MISKNLSYPLAILVLLVQPIAGFCQPTQIGPLDFLKSKDSSFALFANTSATLQAGKQYPNELVLLTGLPNNPAISARIDLLGSLKPLCQPSEPCGGIRNVVISPDGDTALVSTDPSDVQAPGQRGPSAL